VGFVNSFIKALHLMAHELVPLFDELDGALYPVEEAPDHECADGEARDHDGQRRQLARTHDYSPAKRRGTTPLVSEEDAHHHTSEHPSLTVASHCVRALVAVCR